MPQIELDPGLKRILESATQTFMDTGNLPDPELLMGQLTKNGWVKVSDMALVCNFVMDDLPGARTQAGAAAVAAKYGFQLTYTYD